jgi:hypothetical protein
MLDERFVLLAITFNIYGATRYLRQTLKGSNRPNRVTWFMWSLAPLVAFIAELGDSVGLPALMTLIIGLDCALIFLASFANPAAHWKLTKFDLTCGAISLLGLMLWLLTRHSELAIGLSIVADAAASVPTIVKAYRHPASENSLLYSFAAVSAIITLLTLQDWTFSHWGFPVYIAADSLLIAAILIYRSHNHVETQSVS